MLPFFFIFRQIFQKNAAFFVGTKNTPPGGTGEKKKHNDWVLKEI